MLEHFREGELVRLGQIVAAWSREELSGVAAREKLFEQVFRGETQYTLGLQSTFDAASRTGLAGAVEGANAGRSLAHSFSSVAVAAAAQTAGRGSAGSTAVPAAFGALGALAGGLMGGISSALLGGARAGKMSQQVFVFVDRAFLRLTQPQAWELAARRLQLKGVRRTPQEVEGDFRTQLRNVLGEATPALQGGRQLQQAPSQATWLQLVELCLALEIVRHIAAPRARQELPREELGAAFRYDAFMLSQRVQSILASVAAAASSGGLPVQLIAARCPSEVLTVQAEDSCPICLEKPAAAAVVRRLPCGHIMHLECCEAWLATAATCPTCRRDVRAGAGRIGSVAFNTAAASVATSATASATTVAAAGTSSA